MSTDPFSKPPCNTSSLLAVLKSERRSSLTGFPDRALPLPIHSAVPPLLFQPEFDGDVGEMDGVRDTMREDRVNICRIFLSFLFLRNIRERSDDSIRLPCSVSSMAPHYADPGEISIVLRNPSQFPRGTSRFGVLPSTDAHCRETAVHLP